MKNIPYERFLDVTKTKDVLNVIELSGDMKVPFHSEIVTQLSYYKSGKVKYTTFQGSARIKKHNVHYFYEIFK